MVTVHRESGLRIVIFTDDHEPAHVHVFGDGAAKIDLAADDGAPALVWAEGMKRNVIRKAIRIVAEQQEHLLECWRDLHG